MPVCTVATLRGWRAQVRSTCGVLGAATVGDEVRAAMDGAVAFGFDWHRCSGQEGSMHAARDVVNLSFQGLHLTADTPSVPVPLQYHLSISTLVCVLA